METERESSLPAIGARLFCPFAISFSSKQCTDYFQSRSLDLSANLNALVGQCNIGNQSKLLVISEEYASQSHTTYDVETILQDAWIDLSKSGGADFGGSQSLPQPLNPLVDLDVSLLRRLYHNEQIRGQMGPLLAVLLCISMVEDDPTARLMELSVRSTELLSSKVPELRLILGQRTDPVLRICLLIQPDSGSTNVSEMGANEVFSRIRSLFGMHVFRLSVDERPIGNLWSDEAVHVIQEIFDRSIIPHRQREIEVLQELRKNMHKPTLASKLLGISKRWSIAGSEEVAPTSPYSSEGYIVALRRLADLLATLGDMNGAVTHYDLLLKQFDNTSSSSNGKVEIDERRGVAMALGHLYQRNENNVALHRDNFFDFCSIDDAFDVGISSCFLEMKHFARGLRLLLFYHRFLCEIDRSLDGAMVILRWLSPLANRDLICAILMERIAISLPATSSTNLCRRGVLYWMLAGERYDRCHLAARAGWCYEHAWKGLPPVSTHLLKAPFVSYHRANARLLLAIARDFYHRGELSMAMDFFWQTVDICCARKNPMISLPNNKCTALIHELLFVYDEYRATLVTRGGDLSILVKENIPLLTVEFSGIHLEPSMENMHPGCLIRSSRIPNGSDHRSSQLLEKLGRCINSHGYKYASPFAPNSSTHDDVNSNAQLNLQSSTNIRIGISVLNRFGCALLLSELNLEYEVCGKHQCTEAIDAQYHGRPVEALMFPSAEVSKGVSKDMSTVRILPEQCVLVWFLVTFERTIASVDWPSGTFRLHAFSCKIENILSSRYRLVRPSDGKEPTWSLFECGSCFDLAIETGFGSDPMDHHVKELLPRYLPEYFLEGELCHMHLRCNAQPNDSLLIYFATNLLCGIDNQSTAPIEWLGQGLLRLFMTCSSEGSSNPLPSLFYCRIPQTDDRSVHVTETTREQSVVAAVTYIPKHAHEPEIQESQPSKSLSVDSLYCMKCPVSPIALFSRSIHINSSLCIVCRVYQGSISAINAANAEESLSSISCLSTLLIMDIKNTHPEYTFGIVAISLPWKFDPYGESESFPESVWINPNQSWRWRCTTKKPFDALLVEQKDTSSLFLIDSNTFKVIQLPFFSLFNNVDLHVFPPPQINKTSANLDNCTYSSPIASLHHPVDCPGSPIVRVLWRVADRQGQVGLRCGWNEGLIT